MSPNREDAFSLRTSKGTKVSDGVSVLAQKAAVDAGIAIVEAMLSGNDNRKSPLSCCRKGESLLSEMGMLPMATRW